MMAGYMIGSMLGGRGTMMLASANFIDPAKVLEALGPPKTESVGSTTGRTKVASSATSRPTFKASTRSRGGFGSSGRRFGSGAT